MKKVKLSLEAFAPLFDKIEKLSTIQRILIYAGTFLVLVGSVVYFLYMPKWEAKTTLETEYEELSGKLMIAKRNAAKLPKLRVQMKAEEEKFALASKALPEQKEIPSLLISVSKSGREAGLAFNLFQPGAEASREFYAEIPVSVKLEGGYHNIAEFFDRVAGLSRIVTIKGISMAPAGKGNKLKASCSAVTYKFIEKKGS